MEVLYQFVISFFATIGFCVYFLAPVKSIIGTGIAGGLSWVVFYIMTYTYDSKIAGTFLAAFLVGSMGEFLAKKLKCPATVFITPGIVPFVPGSGMYYTMFYISQNDFSQATKYGSETFLMAAAIAIGIITSSVFSKSLKAMRAKAR